MICIKGGKVYDPANGVDGVVKDIWIDKGCIIAEPERPENVEIIDAAGCLIAPAGVEAHTHVAGAQLNTARRILNDPAASQYLLPPSALAAERYLKMGYTTVFDAAMSTLFSRLTRSDLSQMPGIDRGAFTVMGDHVLLHQAVDSGDDAALRDAIGWLLQVSGGYAVKLVNPGGGLAHKNHQAAPHLDDPIGNGKVTQRQFIQKMVCVVNDMLLPHPVHLHAGFLGVPGNSVSFCDTVRSLEGRRAHLCHIQFYCYGDDGSQGYTSAAAQVAQVFSENPELTCDIGQVIFGQAMAVSCDTSGLSYLHSLIHAPWASRQIEGEGGSACLPLAYLTKDAASAVQWAAGLELMLRFPDPARIFLTTDHPNGGQFDMYPMVISWLMDKEARQKVLHSIHKAGTEKSGLAEIDRELSLCEIISMTSAGPAKALGLSDRGHLGVDATADIRCYQPDSDKQKMFANPCWVMRHGEIVVKNGKIITPQPGSTLAIRPDWDESRRVEIEAEMQKVLSIPVEQYGLGNDIREEEKIQPCR
jgi:formylmethanofuran dehydrogenase subunit A